MPHPDLIRELDPELARRVSRGGQQLLDVLRRLLVKARAVGASREQFGLAARLSMVLAARKRAEFGQ